MAASSTFHPLFSPSSPSTLPDTACRCRPSFRKRTMRNAGTKKRVSGVNIGCHSDGGAKSKELSRVVALVHVFDVALVQQQVRFSVAIQLEARAVIPLDHAF